MWKTFVAHVNRVGLARDLFLIGSGMILCGAVALGVYKLLGYPQQGEFYIFLFAIIGAGDILQTCGIVLWFVVDSVDYFRRKKL